MTWERLGVAFGVGALAALVLLLGVVFGAGAARLNLVWPL